MDLLVSLKAYDIKEYPVKGSEGDKMRIIFSIENIAEALNCYRKLSSSRNTPIKESRIIFRIYYLLPGKLFFILLFRACIHAVR